MKKVLLILFIIPTYLFPQVNNKKVFLAKNSPLSEKSITVISTDSTGLNWIGTLEGLICYNGQRWVNLNTENSKLPSNKILCIEIHGNTKYIGTTEGLLIIKNNDWEVFTECGREKTGIKVIDWVKKSVELGAGEILLTSVDREGTAKGMDIELIKAVTAVVTLPVIASGGVGNLNDIGLAVEEGGADAISIAHVLHYEELTINKIRQYCIEKNIPVRKLSEYRA
jgi:hypothetical protein